MEDCLHVRFCPEDVALCLQFLPEFPEIVDLPIADHGDGTILVLDGLHPAVQINETQAVEPQGRPVQQQGLAAVRPPVADGGQHPFQDIFIRFLAAVQIKYPADGTHAQFSFSIP